MALSRVIGAVVIAIATVSVAHARYGDPQDKNDKNSIPVTVGDLTRAQLIEVKDANGVVLLHGTLKTRDNTVKETERKADLESPTGQGAKGKITIEIAHKIGKDIKDEIEVVVEKLPTMTNCDLWIDGQRVGAFVTSKQGMGDLKLSRKAG